jgi:bacteriocin-like protein
MNEFSTVSADELTQIEGGGLLGDIVSAAYNIGKAIVNSQIQDATTIVGGAGKVLGTVVHELF